MAAFKQPSLQRQRNNTQRMRKLFGTDGIRGIAGEFPLYQETTFAIGHALAQHLTKKAQKQRVVVGQDTRDPSGWIGDTVGERLKARGEELSSSTILTHYD